MAAPQNRSTTSTTTARRRPRPAPTAAPIVEIAVADEHDDEAALEEQRNWIELRRLQLETERAELEVAALRRQERSTEALATLHHEYTFYSEVSSASVQECMGELSHWSRRDPGAPFTVVFNSPGGSVLDGLALYDFLRHLQCRGHHLTTVALGRAASMGAVLLQAGDHRVIGENAFLLVHEVSHLSHGKVSEMEDGVEFSRRLQQRLVAILAGRSRLTERQIQARWARKEWWLDAAEALTLGLADAIL